MAAVRDIANVGYQSTYGGDSPRRQPHVGSAAMREIDAQSAYAGTWDSHPVDTAYTHIGLLLTAGEDAMLSFADLVSADRTPTYAHLPVARSGIEWLALAHWLSDPDVGVGERVRRSLNERIASAYDRRGCQAMPTRSPAAGPASRRDVPRVYADAIEEGAASSSRPRAAERHGPHPTPARRR